MKPQRETLGIAGLFVLGCLFVMVSFTASIPSQSNLNKVSGELGGVRAKKRLIIIELKGDEAKYGYLSFGRQCGNVYEKMAPHKDRPITLYYDPRQTKPLMSGSYHSVYGIRGETMDICSYAKISFMHQHSNSVGLRFGSAMIVLALLAILRMILVKNK